MLDPRELRIGNYVFYGDTPRKITMVCDNQRRSIAVDLLNVSSDIVSPIPLTTDILEKCGFAFDGAGFIAVKGAGKNEYRPIIWPHKKYYKWQPDKFMSVKIFFVHQLQNLYFSLTNEELKINL